MKESCIGSVFETPDEPEIECTPVDNNRIAPESEDIIIENVSPTVAFKMFAGRAFSGVKIDCASDGVNLLDNREKKCTLVSFDSYRETPAERLMRLQLECTELANDLNDITKVLGADDSNLFETLHVASQQLREDLAKLGTFSYKRSEPQLDSSLLDIRAQLRLEGDKMSDNDEKFSDLESRILSIENMLGILESGDGCCKDKLGPSLNDWVSIIESRCAIMNPAQVILLKQLVDEALNDVKNFNAAQSSIDREGCANISIQIQAVYDIMQKWDGVRTAIPLIIERLEVLDSLHRKSILFLDRLASIERDQSVFNNLIIDVELQLNTMKSSLAENMKAAQNSFESLKTRMVLILPPK